jgi:exodeoxyribonuclease VII large subunit
MSRPLFSALFDEVDRRPFTVSELTNAVRNALEARFSSVWLEGEISNFKAHSSGHWYFTLKDDTAQIRAKCFRTTNARIRFRPIDGLHVRARGRLTVYAPRGEYELLVESLDPVGAGALRIAFEQLRDRLQAEGLFARELKRPLPIFPRRVGVVTSSTGAAIRDVVNVISRRTQTVHLLFSPALVQGDAAGSDIARAIRLLNDFHQRALSEGRQQDTVDVMIVGRGGGSTEDLWAFNTEEVARAIRTSKIPVISAVGHETDFTIADLAADLRAPTPSAAAELVAAQEDQICSALAQLRRNLTHLVQFRIVNARTRVQEQALSRVFEETRARLRNARLASTSATHQLQILFGKQLRRAQARTESVIHKISPAHLKGYVQNQQRRLDSLHNEGTVAMKNNLEEARKRLGLAAASLDALSPLGVLKRGYAIAQANGRLVRDSRDVAIGDKIKVRLSQGNLKTRVESKEDSE